MITAPYSSDSPSPHTRRATWFLDLALLTLLCAFIYALGLTTHGLTNWQESQRALVVQEMHARGDWLVPTINNQPYLAKPPWFYWTQLALNKVLGGTPGELELRLSVAIGGTLGVLATYVVARRLARDWSRAPWSGQTNGLRGHDRDPDRYARLVGVWSALMLATGILYTRSSRIGELDIWIVPFVVTSIGAIHAAWRAHVDRATTNFAAVALAIASAIGAALAKGPPAVLPIATGAYGAIALWAAYSDRAALPNAKPAHANAPPQRDSLLIPSILAAIFAIALGTFTATHADKLALDRIVGTLIIAALAGFIGFTLGKLTNSARGWACFRAYSRTHPVAVLGLPILVLFIWGKLVGMRIGPENAAAWAQKEAEDNLQVLVAISPIKNLEAASYGVGLASIFAIVGLIWLWRAKPKMTLGAWIALAWVALSFAGYSMLGKGIARYMTPVWPGMAILAGMVVASLITERASFFPRRGPSGRLRLCTVLVFIVAALAIGQSYWYGLGRELKMSQRSPRAVMHELLDPTNAAKWGVREVDRTRIGSFEYWTAATSVYAGTRVHPVGDIFIRDKTAGGAPMSLDDLRASIIKDGPWILFIRERQPNDPERVRRGIDPEWMRPAIDRLRDAGFVVTPLDVKSLWVVDGSAEIPYFPVRVEVGT